MNNLRILLALALSFLPLANASAGNGTITTKDAGGVTRTFSIVTDGSGNFIARQVICDQSAAAACASVGTAGSPSTNAVTIQAVTLGAGTAANAMRVELPTDGTGKVTAAQATAANLNATVVGTGTFAVQNNAAVIGQTASGSAVTGNPVRVGMSDGTNAQNWLTALALGDGVNGNNTGAVAGWLYNGSTWDRASGTAALGQYVQAKSGGFAVGSGTDGWDVSTGITTATAASVGGTGSVNAKLRLMTSQLDAINTGIGSAIPAGTNTIGTVGQLPYPVGATPITASATGTTGATTATLAGTSGKTTYICGYSIRANATANTNVTNTITGVITATLSSIMWVPANTAGLGIDEQIFSPCIPASATNTGIAIVSGAPGTGGLVSSKGWGYQF